MDIYTALKADHKVVKGILSDIEELDDDAPKKRVSLLRDLKEALVPHARAEETVLYEPLKASDVDEADDLAYEGYEEHAVADHLIEQLDGTEATDPRWKALFSVLKENLEHHIREEESDIFSMAKKSFDEETAIEMNDRFQALKKDELAQLLREEKASGTKSKKIPGAAAKAKKSTDRPSVRH